MENVHTRASKKDIKFYISTGTYLIHNFNAKINVAVAVFISFFTHLPTFSLSVVYLTTIFTRNNSTLTPGTYKTFFDT